MSGVGRGRFEGIAFWSVTDVAVGLLVFLAGIVTGLVPVDDPGAGRAAQTRTAGVEPAVRSPTGAEAVATTTSEEPPSPLLARGEVQRLTARQVWLRLGAGQNVVVIAGGRRMAVPDGTGEMVVGI